MSTRAPRPVSSPIVGMLALIRPSSVITVPSSGMLRSARSRTTCPPTSRSMTDFIGLAGQARGDQRGEVGQPVAVAPLVVVPADHLDLIARCHRQRRVERAGPGRADDV